MPAQVDPSALARFVQKPKAGATPALPSIAARPLLDQVIASTTSKKENATWSHPARSTASPLRRP
jgi:hypothetical protein